LRPYSRRNQGGQARKEKAVPDKDEIRELLARYCFTLDEGRPEDMAALFTSDGVWETAFGIGRGREGIVAEMKSIATEPRPKRLHLATNIVIDLDGEQASVRSNWVVFKNSSTSPVIGAAGSYYDHVVKVGGRWFFAYRRIDRFIAEGKE
jgi:uncharacterized protein (TIGR02246 family)